MYVDGDAAGQAYTALGGLAGLRGFGYWDIAQDDPQYSLVSKLAKYVPTHAGPAVPPPPPADDKSSFVLGVIGVCAALVVVGLVCAVVMVQRRGAEGKEKSRRLSDMYEPIA